jgi:hypothetical protein
MRLVMGIVCHPNGVFYARKLVPDRLREAVAIVTNAKVTKVSWLKRSLRTRDPREANIRGKPVLAEYDDILGRAEASLTPLPLRESLTRREIDRIADYYYAEKLAEDDEIRLNGTGSEPLRQATATQLADMGIQPAAGYLRAGPPPEYGLSPREILQRAQTLDWVIPSAQLALAMGNIGSLEEEEVSELLITFGINLDRKSAAFRELGLALLKKRVEAYQAIADRMLGEPIETPHVSPPASSDAPLEAGTLGAAFEGWKKLRNRSVSTTKEFQYALGLFEQLHGAIPIASITRSHVRRYRDALQLIPVRRAGKLRNAGLSELGEWAKAHPEAPRISIGTINKLLGGPMAIAN